MVINYKQLFVILINFSKPITAIVFVVMTCPAVWACMIWLHSFKVINTCIPSCNTKEPMRGLFPIKTLK